MEIGRAHRSVHLDQQLRILNGRRFYSDTVINGPDSGKHLAANLPGVMPPTLWVG
jgi:hypothetical protein